MRKLMPNWKLTCESWQLPINRSGTSQRAPPGVRSKRCLKRSSLRCRSRLCSMISRSMAMSMGYRRHAQQAEGSTDPGWMLICTILAVALCLIALPWIAIGFLVERSLARWLHWKLSFLLWTVLLFVCAFILYSSYQHGLQSMIAHELAGYLQAAKHHQYDLAHWPLRALWADTWPVWLHTVAGIGIAGFAAELTANRNDTVRTLRQQEQSRQHRAQRAQRRAKRRTSQPAYLPDQIGGAMVIGVPIHDDQEET